MVNDRVKDLITKIESAMCELVAECAYLEMVCRDQAAELKQLKFEASGVAELRRISDKLPADQPEVVGLSVLDMAVDSEPMVVGYDPELDFTQVPYACVERPMLNECVELPVRKTTNGLVLGERMYQQFLTALKGPQMPGDPTESEQQLCDAYFDVTIWRWVVFIDIEVQA